MTVPLRKLLGSCVRLLSIYMENGGIVEELDKIRNIRKAFEFLINEIDSKGFKDVLEKYK